MRSAPPLRSVRNDWHRLFDAGVPRLVEGADVRMLWSTNHYDGPACGVCSYDGEPHWFDRISGGSHFVEYRGLEIASSIYAIVRLTPDEYQDEKRRSDLFRELVGDHCTYTYREDGERVRGAATCADQVGGMERWRLAVGEQKPFDRFYDREVVGWWSA